MAITDRLRAAVGRIATRLRGQPSASTPAPAFPIGNRTGIGPVINKAAEQRIAQDKEGALRSRVAVNAGPYSDRISTYPGSYLDPQKIDRIFRMADLGVAIWQYAELCKQMRERDAHLMGIDRQRRQGVANKPFLLWPRLETDPVQVAMAHLLRSVFHDINGFKAAIYSSLSKNCDGWSMNEIVWEPGKIRFQVPDGNGGGPLVTVNGIWPRNIFWVHPKHTMFALDSTDEPLLNVGAEGAIRLPEHKFLYTMTPGDGIASARGYSRAVVWLHFFKHASIRDWNVFLHLYGIPFLQGKLSREYYKDTEMKGVLEEAMENYGDGDHGVILPDGIDITVKDPVSMGGAGDAHKSIAGFMNAEQSKAVLGETLTTEAGESGSYKLGDVHADSAQEVIIGDAGTTSEDVRRDVALSAIELNAEAISRAFEEHGIKAPPDELPMAISECGFRTDREWTPMQRLEIIRGATSIGLTASKAQVRNELQIDAPTSEADTLRGAAVAIPAGGKAAGASDASDGVDNPKPEDKNPPGKK